MSPMKETSPQVSGSCTEPFLGYQTESTAVQSLNDSKKRQSEIQRHEMKKTANDIGDDNISLPKITSSQIEERLVGDSITNEFYMPRSSTIVLTRKKEKPYVSLDSENAVAKDAYVDSAAYVSAIVQNELDRIKQQASVNIFGTDNPPNFQIQVANGQLEKSIATVILNFDIGDHTFAEHFVVMKVGRGPL